MQLARNLQHPPQIARVKPSADPDRQPGGDHFDPTSAHHCRAALGW
jgi:hypothetical protein